VLYSNHYTFTQYFESNEEILTFRLGLDFHAKSTFQKTSTFSDPLKLAPRNNRAANQAAAAQRLGDKNQPGPSLQQPTRFINASNLVAVSSSAPQGLIATSIAGRQGQQQKPIQVILPATTANGQVLTTSQGIPSNQQIIFIQNPPGRQSGQGIRQPIGQAGQPIYLLQNGNGQNNAQPV
jgi:hypothetical protein